MFVTDNSFLKHGIALETNCVRSQSPKIKFVNIFKTPRMLVYKFGVDLLLVNLCFGRLNLCNGSFKYLTTYEYAYMEFKEMNVLRHQTNF